jgi:hypothetical protein
MPAGAASQDGSPVDEPSYCAELQQVVALAATKERFASITGPAREGNFASARLSLPGWSDCALYGARTYTCDSMKIGTEAAAESRLATTVAWIRTCLGDSWREVTARSSSRYVVLHGAGAVSITLSTDRLDQEQFVVRLTLFLRTQ